MEEHENGRAGKKQNEIGVRAATVRVGVDSTLVVESQRPERRGWRIAPCCNRGILEVETFTEMA